MQFSTSARNIQNILRIVVCPLFQSPAAVANTIPNGTCYTTFYAWYQKTKKDLGKLYAVEFDLSNTSPQPFNVQFYKYNEDGNANAFSTDVTPVADNVVNEYIQYGANWS